MRVNFFSLCVLAMMASGLFFFTSWFFGRQVVVTADVSAGTNVPQPPAERVITQATSPLEAPTSLVGTLSAAADQITLNWNGVQSQKIVSYRVVRNAKTVAETSFPWFADSTVTINESYGYYIQAIDEDGRASSPSNFVIVTARLAVVPPPSTSVPTAAVSTPTPKPTAIAKTTNTNKPKTVTVTKPTPAPTPATTPTPTISHTDDEAPAPVTVVPPAMNINTAPPVMNTNTAPPPTNTNTAPPRVPQTYSIDVYRNGTFSTTAITIVAGDKITFHYADPGSEIEIRFTPSVGNTSRIIIDSERRSRTVTFSTAGTFTFKQLVSPVDTGTVTVLSA